MNFLTEIKYIGLPKLTEDQIAGVCQVGELAARKVILSRIPKRAILDLNITVEAVVEESLIFTVDVDVTLSPFYKVDVDSIVEEAVDEAFKAIEERLRELSCNAGEEA
ncbi:MAG: hypothetical protein DRJ20_02080 [Candidatus Methanomethylicota archaeon]|uniref:DUF3194 domain-containing protein n=2 Tax=Thermoproteota archaeon TaxID=2056631 RepID=A0A497EW87_9CREN|nr:MAG: hypothetical protein DRJ20_02080 [Candidatus Verstraetearchaeota archaeon]